MPEDEIPAELLDAVEQQLASPQTAYVAKTLKRLMGTGLAQTDAKSQIALILGEQMNEMMRRRSGFDEKAYKEALKELPLIQDEEQEAP